MPKFSFIFFLLRSDQIKDYAETLSWLHYVALWFKSYWFCWRRIYKTWVWNILDKILLSNMWIIETDDYQNDKDPPLLLYGNFSWKEQRRCNSTKHCWCATSPASTFFPPKKSEHLYNLCEDDGEIFFPWGSNNKLQIIVVIIFLNSNSN